MKRSFCAVLIGLVGLGFAVQGAQAAGRGTTGSDSSSSTGDQLQPANTPAVSPTARRARKSRPATSPAVPASSVSSTASEQRVVAPGQDCRHDDSRRSHSQPTTIVFFNQTSSVADEVALVDYVNSEVQGYYQPGYEWGAGVRGHTVDWAEFVPYLRQYIVVASSIGKDAFRRGFIAGYGGSAEATYDRALRRACQRS